jgi:hypothetical protein
MSDTTGAFPPPPPAAAPPPTYGAPPASPPRVQLPPGYKLPPGYQGPTAPDYAQPYQYQQAQHAQPYQQPQPFSPAGALWGIDSFLSQFGGAALYSIIAGLASILVPLFTTFYFPILPIAGMLNAARAIQQGRLIGGIVGLVLSALGGLVSLFASGLVGG